MTENWEQELPENGHKVLLINTHAYDFRLPWAKWHQPTGLLQVGSFLKKRECDVRFIDCLHWDIDRNKVRRRKIGTVEIEGYSIDVWRFGTYWGHLTDYVRHLKKQGWVPDHVFVSCFQSSWWGAANDLIDYAKTRWFPASRFWLGGVYPLVEPVHARKYSGADIIATHAISAVRNEVPDILLYPEGYRPSFAGIYLYEIGDLLDAKQHQELIPRAPENIAEEVAQKVTLGVREFAFFDDEVRIEFRQHFQETLRQLTSANLDTRFVAVGNISPEFIDGKTARLMREVGYRSINLHSRVTSNGSSRPIYDNSYEAYTECVNALVKEGGFKSRNGGVTAMILVGNPNEQIESVTEHLMKVASIVGAVNLTQYQGDRSSHPEVSKLFENNEDLFLLNCKLYPFARATGNSFRDYVELTRLAALLNSKYRGRTFDFLNGGFTAHLVREGISSGNWRPLGEPDESTSEVIPLLPLGQDRIERDNKK